MTASVAIASQPSVKLNDGGSMPQLGLGLMRFGGEDMTEIAIERAFDAGYRLFDTASVYGTEPHTGRALRSLDCPRSELFITTVNDYDAHRLLNRVSLRGRPVIDVHGVASKLIDRSPIPID